MAAKRSLKRIEAVPLAEDLDPRLGEILAEIEQRRVQLGWSLEELTRRARRLKQLPQNSSTLRDWRRGASSPKFLDLDDFAHAVGFRVGPLWQDASTRSETVSQRDQRGSQVSTWMRKLESVMARVPEEIQKEIYELGHEHAQRWGRIENPIAPGAAKKP